MHTAAHTTTTTTAKKHTKKKEKEAGGELAEKEGSAGVVPCTEYCVKAEEELKNCKCTVYPQRWQ